MAFNYNISMRSQKYKTSFKSTVIIVLFFALFFFAFAGESGVWVRYNRAGIMPDGPKTLVVMAEKELKGTVWTVADGSGKTVLSGKLDKSVCGVTGHTPKPFNYVIDVSRLKKEGRYRMTLDKQEPVSFNIRKAPYAFIVPDIMLFLKAARSGTSDTLFHKASHLGDAAAILHRPKDGNYESGLWEPVPNGRKVDMLGGWYDAGDYIKFTLTTAYTCYFLLKAYEVNPRLFKDTRKYSRTALIDVLDEVKFGLDYLLKTFPDKDTFIFQVAGRLDHGYWRLPEKDTRDGKRVALSAISQPHMGLTTAALALGARIFAEAGYPDEAKRCREKAVAIFERALAPDALRSGAFEFNPNGNFTFYRDKTGEDNMVLGAMELYRLTKNESYLKIAKGFGIKAGWDVYWGSLFLLANTAMAPHDDAAKKNIKKEVALYLSKAKNNIWGIPGRYTWGSLANWAAIGGGMGLFALQSKDPEIKDAVTLIHDYIFGRNN